MGTSKAKKRSAYTDDGWHCDKCLGTQTSLRRNGPNGQRMCTACYSKMQREKKKGEVNGCCSQLPAQQPESDSQLSVRGARPASAAARKFIEEFARNKGAWETSGRQDGGSRRDVDMQEAETQNPAYGLNVLSGAALRGSSEGLLAKAPFGVRCAGVQLLTSDANHASSRTMRYMTDRTHSTGIAEGRRSSRHLSPDGPFPLTAPWADNSFLQSQRQDFDHEELSVLQGAQTLMLLQQQSSPHENVRKCMPVTNGSGSKLAGNSLPQLTDSWLSKQGQVPVKGEPAEQVVSGTCMSVCADHLPDVGALPDHALPRGQITTFQTCSAPASLVAQGTPRGGGRLLGEGGTMSSMTSSVTLQGRQQSEPCIPPYSYVKDDQN